MTSDYDGTVPFGAGWRFGAYADGQPGPVTVRASHPGLGRAEARIRVRMR